MKYNLRTLKGKRIVGGDPNLATKNEVHITKVPQELGIEGGSNFKEDYYIIDYYKLKTYNNALLTQLAQVFYILIIPPEPIPGYEIELAPLSLFADSLSEQPLPSVILWPNVNCVYMFSPHLNSAPIVGKFTNIYQLIDASVADPSGNGLTEEEAEFVKSFFVQITKEQFYEMLM